MSFSNAPNPTFLFGAHQLARGSEGDWAGLLQGDQDLPHGYVLVYVMSAAATAGDDVEHIRFTVSSQRLQVVDRHN